MACSYTESNRWHLIQNYYGLKPINLLALYLFDRLPIKSDNTEDSSSEIGIYLDQ